MYQQIINDGLWQHVLCEGSQKYMRKVYVCQVLFGKFLSFLPGLRSIVVLVHGAHDAQHGTHTERVSDGTLERT
jgi:hypothetical protein